METPFFTNDAIVLGLLMTVVAWVFYTSNSPKPFWKKFYTFVPSILLCYFLPALLNWPLGLIDGEESSLYFVASRYLLPASLVLLCLSIDLKGIINLGPKAIIMFLAATVGIILGGPLAILVISTIAPGVLDVGNGEEVWRGLTTVAGSWIGGGANQASMKEIFGVSDNLFATMIVVDVICANIWTGFLLYGASITKRVDRWLKSDTSAIDELKDRVEKYQASIAKIPNLSETFMILAIAFGGTALALSLIHISEPTRPY